MRPKHNHDCKQCMFVGQVNGLDLYYCTPASNQGTQGMPKNWLAVSYLARYGSEPSHYFSGHLRHPENTASATISDISLRLATIQACAFAIYRTLSSETSSDRYNRLLCWLMDRLDALWWARLWEWIAVHTTRKDW